MEEFTEKYPLCFKYESQIFIPKKDNLSNLYEARCTENFRAYLCQITKNGKY